VLGARVVALDLEGGRRRPGDAVEEDRLFDRRDERVADPAEHRVVGPDRQPIAALGLERAYVRQEGLLLRRVRRPPHAVLHVLRETTVYGEGCRPSALTSQAAWKTCIALCVSSVGMICVIEPRFR
jgi:hypothetical protein